MPDERERKISKSFFSCKKRYCVGRQSPALLSAANRLLFVKPASRLRGARKDYRTRDQARAGVFDYVEGFSNPTRRHSTIGYVSPMEFERVATVA